MRGAKLFISTLVELAEGICGDVNALEKKEKTKLFCKIAT